MATELASLVVRISAQTDQMKDELRRLRERLDNTTKSTFDLQRAMIALAGAAATGVAVKRFIDLGAAVAETASKFETVMGPATASVQAELDRFANTAGLTNAEAQGLVATSASIAQGMGFAQEEAAGFSTEILRLSADLGSFNNQPTAEVIQRVNAALAGEREGLKQLGIVIRETDVQQRALANTGKDTAASLTQQDKATATLQLVTERAGVAVGDLERTSDSLANQTKATEARLRDMRDELALGAAQGLKAAGVMSELNDVLRELGGTEVGGAAAAMVKAIFEPFAEWLNDVEKSIVAFKGLGRAFSTLLSTIQSGGGITAAWRAFNEEIAKSEDHIKQIDAQRERLASEANAEADAQERTADAAERTQAAVTGTQRAVSFSMGPAQQSLNVGKKNVSNQLGFDLPGIGQIPETLAVADKEASKLSMSLGSASQATRLLQGDLGTFVSALASGGVIGGIVAGISSILDSAEEQARRIQAAREHFERALDAYVNELADMSRWERLQHNAVEGAKATLTALMNQFAAGIKSDKVRGQLEAAFAAAIEGLDMAALEDLLAQFGPEGQAILEEFKRRLEEVNRLREEEATEAERAAEAAAEAARQLKLAAFEAAKLKTADVFADFTARDLALKGDDRGALSAELTARAHREIAALQELVDAGALSEAAMTRLASIIWGEVNVALGDFDEAARSAADAAREAARAEQFRQMVDTENLRIRLLVSQGLDDEAFRLKQNLELLQAVEQGRSDEYIALLKQIHAQDAANRAAREQTETLNKQADAAREATRALDGTLRVLNGPAGFTAALYRNQALRGLGSADFGVSSPSFSTPAPQQTNNSFEITIQTQPGQDNVTIGQQVYDQIVAEVERQKRLGGYNRIGGF